MRMIFPTLRERKIIVKLLTEFYEARTPRGFNIALAMFCKYYRLRKPKIVWFEYLDNGKTWGETYENGKIHLVHPEHWKASLDEWINTLFHELGHYVLWADHERKANLFATKMVQGVKK